MRKAILILLLGLPCASAVAQDQDVPAAKRAFVEIESARRSYWVEEPIRLAVRFGLDRRFFRTNAVPLFTREVELPVQVLAPFLDDLPGTERLPEPATVEGSVTFVLNTSLSGAAAEEDREIDGRPHRVLSFSRTVVAVEPGELVLPAPRIRFAYGTDFEDDFLNGRTARDRTEVVIQGMPLRLEVKPLPTPRPASFSGAVGVMSHTVDIAPREVDIGESMKLTLTVRGEGNLERFAAPPLDLEGFHVYGVIEVPGDGVRTFVYDLAPVTGGITELPSVPFTVFGPSWGKYMTWRSPAIPITVRGEPAGPTAAPEREEPHEGNAAVWIAVFAACFAAALVVLLVARRGRREEPVDPEEQRARAAATVFGERIAAPDSDLAGAFGEYLSARLRAPTASLIGPGLTERLAGAGVPRDLASRTASRMEELVAVRYGGVTSEDAAAACRSLVLELEEIFHREERRG